MQNHFLWLLKIEEFRNYNISFYSFFSVFERCMVILKPSDIRQLPATSGKFVCTQAAVFSANMIGQKAYALYFGVKSLSQRSQILTASSMPGSLLIANRHLKCELEIKCLHYFQQHGIKVFLKFYVFKEKYYTYIYSFHQEL